MPSKHRPSVALDDPSVFPLRYTSRVPLERTALRVSGTVGRKA